MQWGSTGFSDQTDPFLNIHKWFAYWHQIKINIFADDTKMANNVDTVEDEEIVNDDLEALQKLVNYKWHEI